MSTPLQQELKFAAPPAKVYSTLMDPVEHAKMTGAPASFEASEGQSFDCHGGFILGRFIELVKNERIVQAWKVKDWEPGIYSLVSIELRPDSVNPDHTVLSLRQWAIPEGMLPHLDKGWYNKYWNPLKEYLED